MYQSVFASFPESTKTSRNLKLYYFKKQDEHFYPRRNFSRLESYEYPQKSKGKSTRFCWLSNLERNITKRILSFITVYALLNHKVTPLGIFPYPPKQQKHSDPFRRTVKHGNVEIYHETYVRRERTEFICREIKRQNVS